MVRLELWYNGIHAHTLVDQTSASAGVWAWHISPTLLARPGYEVRIIDVVMESNFAISAAFTLLPSIEVSFPPPHFTLSPDSVFTLSWTTSGTGLGILGNSVRVRLCLGTNSTASHTVATLVETNKSSVGWRVPVPNITGVGDSYWLTFELLEDGASIPISVTTVPIYLQDVSNLYQISARIQWFSLPCPTIPFLYLSFLPGKATDVR
jgi:hypothetical protein